MFQPGLTSLVPQVSDDPQKANGVSRVSQGLATLAGPAMAGTLVAVVSPASVFAVNAFTFVVSGLCLAALRLPHFTPDRTASTLQNLVAGWVEFRSRSWLWSVILIWWVLGVFVWGPITPVGAASVIEAHGKAAFGWVESAFGAGCVLGGLVAIRIKPVRPLYAGGIAMCLFPLVPLAAGLVPSVPVMMLGYGLSGIGWAYWGVQWATAVQTQIPQDKLNRVAAYEIAGSILAVPFGQAVAGPASSLVGVHELLVLGAVISLGCALALLAVRPVRQLALDEQP
uniref:MFS transporter n=1 Tax=Streptomyces polyasparticus TaxID=2767826 RepID=UPI001BE46206|nr:MFS transporter [Streptomyces polyasparticus]